MKGCKPGGQGGGLLMASEVSAEQPHGRNEQGAVEPESCVEHREDVLRIGDTQCLAEGDARLNQARKEMASESGAGQGALFPAKGGIIDPGEGWCEDVEVVVAGMKSWPEPGGEKTRDETAGDRLDEWERKTG